MRRDAYRDAHSHFLTRSNGLSDRGAVCVRDWHALINPNRSVARSFVRLPCARHDTGVLKKREILVTENTGHLELAWGICLASESRLRK